MYPELYQAIEDSVAKGVPPRAIVYGLMQAGWPQQAVNDTMNSWLITHGRAQKTTGFKNWLKKYRRQALPALIVMVVLNTISSAIALLRPLPLKILADSVFGNLAAPGPLKPYTHTPELIAIVSLLTLLIFLAGQLFDFIKDIVLLKIGFWLNKNIKAESFSHILHLPLYHQQRLAKGDYVYRQNTVTNSLSDLVLASTSHIIESIIMVCGVLIIMLRINVQLTIISVILVPFLFVLIRLLGPTLGKIARELAQLASSISAHISESVDNAETVQAFNLEDRQVNTLTEMWQKSYHLSMRSMLWGKLFNFVNGLLVILGTSAVMYWGGIAVFHDHMTLGDLLIFITYMGYLLGPIQEVSQQITSRRQKYVDVHRVYEVLSDHEDIENERKDQHMPPVRGRIQFQNVSYSYGKEPGLKNINLTIEPGEKVGIIGPSGSGKTTLLKLLPLYITPTFGSILIDNIDIQSVSLFDLRRNIAWISQTPQLFSTTIVGNIMAGDIFRQVTNEEILAAAQGANLPEFVDKLPLGYGTPTGENGSSLSGGQRQRISIARALIKNAPIICMDEPTSALDDRSEELVRQSISHLIQGKTVLMVTHRPSLLALMDTVYVIENGVLRNVNEYGGYERYAHYLTAHEQL